MTERKNAAKTPGRPFAPGNPGKPKGARHKATLAAEALLEGEAQALTRRAISLALAGDTTAMRLCLERLVPPRRERAITLDLPSIASGTDVPAALASIIQAVARGDLTPGEGSEMAVLIDRYRAAYELEAVENRLTALEATRGK